MSIDAAEALQQGDAALEAGDLSAALAQFQAALASDAASAAAWLGVARVRRRQGQLAEAEDACVQALEADPELAPAWVELVHIEREGGAPEAAAENLASALRTLPGHPALTALLAPAPGGAATSPADGGASDPVARVRAFLAARDLDAAVDFVRALMLEDQESPIALLCRAEVFFYTESGNPARLVHALTRLVRADASQWQAQSALGRILLRRSPLQNTRMALAYCEDAWRASGEHPLAAVGLLEAWRAAGKRTLADALEERMRRVGVEAASPGSE